MRQEFYSNGKLLLSGEYAVLDGALAWAIPTKFGQYLQLTTNSTTQLSWKSLDEKGKTWFEGRYELDTLKEIAASAKTISNTLQNILLKTKQLNPEFLTDFEGYAVETKLTFPRNWGLGTSSTLINNIAQWAQVNAHELLAMTMGGSGYDIACAKHDKPILYTLKDTIPAVQEIPQSFSFYDSLYFVFLNKKKNSSDGIAAFRKQKIDTSTLVNQITQLTKAMITSTNMTDFEKQMVAHEKLLSNALGMPTVKSELFSDFSGEIKSLGAWGGDFVLATGDQSTPDYFKNKGYPIVFPFEKMIL